LLSLLGTLLAWAIAGSQLGSSLHFAVISHEICDEHGELVHAGEHASAHQSARDHQATSVSEGASAHAHEHCSHFGRPEDKAILASPPAVEIVSPAAREVAWQPHRDSVVVAQSTRLLAAPKTSPPV